MTTVRSDRTAETETVCADVRCAAVSGSVRSRTWLPADVELSKIGSFEAALLAYVDRDHAPLMQEINQTGGYNDEIEGKLKGILDSFKATQSW
ncbi:hypothetical protein ACVXG8_07540 [Escherichia coli]